MMPLPALVVAPQLADFPGAPFPVLVMDAASESVRSEAGWHIAPVISETVLVDGSGSALLLLPTLRITSVSSVRVLSADGFVEYPGWRQAGSGMLYHASGWGYGVAGIEVTMSHGYDAAPADLLPVVAARCQRALVHSALAQRSETTGPFTESESYNVARLVPEENPNGLARYRLNGRVA